MTQFYVSLLQNLKQKTIKKVRFTAVQFEKPMEGSFFSFMKNTWIGDSGTLCHIVKDDAGLYDITDINE